jgi:prophage tail gpP-like protein
MADEIILKIEGVVYDGWTSISVQRDLASLTTSFSLGLTDRAPGAVKRQVIQKGQACQLYIGSDLLVTGWIEKPGRQLNAQGHTISASGRDQTCDLIDCSTVGKPGSWKNQKLDRIVTDLIKPFGLTLDVKASIGAAFANFAIEPGESVFDTITRACRMRGVMIGTDANGNVLLFTPSKVLVSGSLEVGRNILDIDVQDDSKDLYSVYVVKGQSQGRDWTTPADAAGPKGTASDPGVTRYRPKVIISDEQASGAGLQARAAWEATTRSAKSQSVTIEVRGWRNDDGKLWEPGTLIPVHAAYVDVDITLMISGVHYTVDQKGQISQLTLVRKEAFSVEPLPEAGADEKAKKSKKSKKGGIMSGLLPDTYIEPKFKPK